jgi:glycerol-3-phosphate O-acyltransferase
LTVEQLLTLLDRYADYLDARNVPVTARPITSRATVMSGLASLERHGVVTRNEHGPDAVYLIQPEQRIAASYYRNSVLHFFLVPAIVDLAAEGALHDEALRLRDVLKFEFFFAEKGEFLAEVDAEARAVDRPITAPFLRPFLEAYWTTAEALLDHGADAVDGDSLRTEACGLAEQLLLQRRIASADAVSSAYVEGAVKLADHRGLLAGGYDLAARRAEFAEELHGFVRQVRAAQARAATHFLEVMRGT